MTLAGDSLAMRPLAGPRLCMHAEGGMTSPITDLDRAARGPSSRKAVSPDRGRWTTSIFRSRQKRTI